MHRRQSKTTPTFKHYAASGHFAMWLGLEDIDLQDCKEWDAWDIHAFSVAFGKKYPVLKSKLCNLPAGEFEHDGLVFQDIWYPYEDQPMLYVIGFGVVVFSATRGERQKFSLNTIIRRIQKIYPKAVKAFEGWGIKEDIHVCTRLLLNEEDLRLNEVLLESKGLLRNGQLIMDPKI